MASSSSSSSGGDDDRRRRRAERRFLRACRKGSLRKAKRRLRRCPTLDLECRVPRGVRSGADAGRTPLHLACAAGAEDLLRWLVKLGADVTPPDDAGDTPAHLLARHAASRPTALDALRRAGADVHRVRDARGETPSDIAARVVERQTRRLLEAEERRAARRDADRRADGASEGLGGVAAARDADAAWREKILDEAAFAEGEGADWGADWGAERARASHASFFASFADDDDPEPYRWREEEEAYRRAGAKRRRAFDAAADAQARAARERDAAAQRILDEARRQDATWRAEVAARSKPSSASTRPSPETYRARWGAAAAKADRGETLAHEDVPWPAREGATIDEVREAVLRGVARGEERRALRSEMLRWHPDKFGARLGRSVRGEDRERTVVRVNAVARMVAELFKRAG